MHEVAGADHGLKVHAGKESKQKTEQALVAVSEAVCQFAQKLKQEHLEKQEAPDASQQRADCKQRSTSKPSSSTDKPSSPTRLTDKPAPTAKRKRKQTK